MKIPKTVYNMYSKVIKDVLNCRKTDPHKIMHEISATTSIPLVVVCSILTELGYDHPSIMETYNRMKENE